jgi:hypothetical protein
MYPRGQLNAHDDAVAMDRGCGLVIGGMDGWYRERLLSLPSALDLGDRLRIEAGACAPYRACRGGIL